MLLAQIFVAGLLARAAVNTNFFREDDGSLGAPALTAKRQAMPGWKQRGELLDVNPVLWLAGHQGGAGVLVWIFVLLALIAVGGFLIPQLFHPATVRSERDFTVVFGAVLLVHVTLKVFLAGQAGRCLAEARRNSTLEIMLCTSLKVEEILRGQVLALKRIFLAPFLLVMLLEMIGIYWLLYVSIGVPAPGRVAYKNFFDILVGLEVGFVIFYLLDLQGVVWTGFWFGLCSKNESAATFKTAFYVIVLPILLLCLYCLGIILFIGWPIAAYVWSRLQLQEHLRFLAGQRSISSGKLTAWLPFHVPNLPENSRPD